MTQGADNNGLDPNASPSAGGEVSVPKYRLDEVSARLRAAEDALRVKDDLINQHMRPPSQVEQINFEEMGLDERAGRAMMAMAEKIASKQVAAAAKGFQQQLAHLGQKTDRAEFLQTFPGKESYIEKINAYRLRQYQETGTAMSMETAYKLVSFDEREARGNQQAPTGQAQAAPARQQAPAAAYVPPAQANQAAPSEDMSLEDMEMALNQEAIRNGGHF